jgi:DNA-binding HxlR family transcriptional regulator
MSDSYGQFCPMASALDEVGQRWSLLILRDLARTPLRFSDLQGINPTVSPTLLTNRLRRLEASGIIERRTIRAPAKTTLYTLAESARPVVGRVLTALVELGAHLLEQGPGLEDPAETLAEQMRLNANFVLARGCELEGYFVFDVGGTKTHVVIDESDFVVTIDQPEEREPDAIARFNPPTTMVRIMGRVLSAAAAEQDGRLAIVGDRDSMLELIRLLSFADVD